MDNKQNNSIEIEKEETETITVVAVEGEEKASELPESAESADAPEESAESADSTETTDKPDESAADEPPKKSKKRIVIPTVCTAVFLISLCVLCGLFVSATTETITVEVGETPRPEAVHDSEFLSSLYAVEPYQIDVSRPGEHEVGLRFFGFLPGELTVAVQDTTPPVLEVTDIHTVAGTVVATEDFILSCTDATEVTVKSDIIPYDTAGEHEILLTAADTSGNKTEITAHLTVWDESHVLAAELNAADLAKTMLEKHPEVTEMDLDDISTGVIGEYIMHAASEDAVYIWPVKVSDTTPPAMEVRRLAIRTGDTVTAEDFVVSVEDVSPCSITFAAEPDYSVQGQQSIRVAAEDIHGSRTEQVTRLFIADIPAEMSMEYGVTAEDVIRELFSKAPYEKRFTLPEIPTEIGTHEFTASSAYGDYTVKLTVADTTPPELVLTDVTVYRGDPVTLENFLVSVSDLSDTACRFADADPSTAEAGDFTVSVEAEDTHGNKTAVDTILHVITDTTPPVIYGTSAKTIMEGESVSFKKGVYAVDDRDGDVTFKVDSSAVNTAKAGTYPVTYTSTDSAGNQASVTVYLTVLDITMDTVNYYADNILWQIVNGTMTQREKAWAIYRWCTGNLTYSTRTSYLMGNYVDGAYSGFTIRSGNCYIYYAVSSVLLTRAGLENIMVQRNDPANPHYWSLVNIGGEWYHFDTCPHYAGHDLQCFLLTDGEVKAYSDNEVKNYYSFDASLYPATPR